MNGTKRTNMNRPTDPARKLTEILATLRRMLSALKGRMVPSAPVPVPVRVRR
jgi:hypothetical protein